MIKSVRSDIWRLRLWKTFLCENRRTGLRLRFDASVDPEVRSACLNFAAWLRKEYIFPLRVPVYIKASYRIRTADGDLVTGSFFEPFRYEDEPYIRIAAGDYAELLAKHGRDNALCAILTCLAHELTHYFQWINALPLTDRGRERQASIYARRILELYSQTRDHP